MSLILSGVCLCAHLGRDPWLCWWGKCASWIFYLGEFNWQMPQLLCSECASALILVMLLTSFFQPLTKHSRLVKAAMFLGNVGLLWWVTLTGGFPIGLAKLSWTCTAMWDFSYLTLLPSPSSTQMSDLNCILQGLFASSSMYLNFFTEISPNKSFVPQIPLWEPEN